MLVPVGNAVAVGVAGSVGGGEITKLQSLPCVGDAVAVGVCTVGDGVGLNECGRVAQRNPSAVGAPDEPGKFSGFQIQLRRAVGFKTHPADVRAVSVTAQIAEAIVVYAEVVGRKILILDAVG